MKAFYIHYQPTQPGHPLEIFVDGPCPSDGKCAITCTLDLDKVHERGALTATGFAKTSLTYGGVTNISGIVFVYVSDNKRRQLRARYDERKNLLTTTTIEQQNEQREF